MAPAVSTTSPVPGVVGACVGLVVAMTALVGSPAMTTCWTILERRASFVLGAIVALQVLALLVSLPRLLNLPHQGVTPLTVGLVALTVGTVTFATVRRHAGVAVTLALVCLLGYTVHRIPAVIDVLVFERHGAAALLQGVNPYSITYPDPFPAELRHLYYGPGIAVGERLHVGFPYPPVSLMLSTLGYVFGDTRYSACLAIGLAALLLSWHAGDRVGRATGASVLAIPGLVFILGHGWTEPWVLMLLTGAVVSLDREWRAAPYLLGALLVSKQYLVFTAPLLGLLLPAMQRASGGVRGFLLRVLVSGAALTLPALLWSPSGFWESVVAFQFRQPFRPDSVSALVTLVNWTGWPPAWTFGVLPLLASTLTALVLARLAPKTPASFAGCVGATLTVMFLTSKQAFGNYYFLAVGAFLIAAAAWPCPTQEREVSDLDRSVEAT